MVLANNFVEALGSQLVGEWTRRFALKPGR
jgi:hypothetical protein